MADAEVRGIGELEDLARAMKAAGSSSGLRRELARELKKAAEGTANDLHASIGDSLPRSGGLAARVASQTRFSVRTSSSGGGVGVSIRSNGRGQLDQMNKSGTFQHPVYGDRSTWVEQSAGVEQGFLDDAFEKSEPDLKRGVTDAIQTIQHKIERSV